MMTMHSPPYEAKFAAKIVRNSEYGVRSEK